MTVAFFRTGSAAAPPEHAAAREIASDEVLIRRIAGGDQLAMQTLFVRHRVALYRWLLRLVGDEALAEDLLSNVFLDVWRHAAKFEVRSSVSTWLLAIARHKAMSALRRRTNDPLDDEIMAEIPDNADSAEVILQKQDDIAVLRQCLTQLSPAHREIIDLVYYHEKSIAEVAEIIGAPQNTVKTRMFYARKRVTELLECHLPLVAPHELHL
jgi:RNA polymerase sigma-70 factor (ECF subfamily)